MLNAGLIHILDFLLCMKVELYQLSVAIVKLHKKTAVVARNQSTVGWVSLLFELALADLGSFQHLWSDEQDKWLGTG